MALGVLSNLSAIYAENNLNNTHNSPQTVLQQLSSGSRINSGADDAAGLSLVNGLAANSAALTQSTTNATEGVGLLQVADGALSLVTSLLIRSGRTHPPLFVKRPHLPTARRAGPGLPEQPSCRISLFPP